MDLACRPTWPKQSLFEIIFYVRVQHCWSHGLCQQLHLWHVLAHTFPYMTIKYVSYMYNLEGDLTSSSSLFYTQHSCYMVYVSDFMCGMCMHIHFLYFPIKYIAYVCHICFWHIYGINLWRNCCSCMYFGTYLQQYWIYMPVPNEDSVTHSCNVVTIFVQWCMEITWNVVCKVCL